jgi:hypothetical protein
MKKNPLISKTKCVPYKTMHRPNFFEVMFEYDYSKFPLSDTISMNFDKEEKKKKLN